MKKFFVLFSMSALLYMGCSSGNPALYTLQMQSELAGSEAKKAKISEEYVVHASAALDSSRKSEKIGDDQLALIQAELSNLRYRVIFAEAKKKKALNDSASVTQALAQDKKRLEEYQTILAKEKSKEAGK